jgi:hypothetical protein
VGWPSWSTDQGVVRIRFYALLVCVLRVCVCVRGCCSGARAGPPCPATKLASWLATATIAELCTVYRVSHVYSFGVASGLCLCCMSPGAAY